MKLFLSLAAVATMFAAQPVSAHAAAPASCPPPVTGQTMSCTTHVSDLALPPREVTPNVCPDGSVVPAGTLQQTIEDGMFHITVNEAGDFWLNSTSQGAFTFIAAPSGTEYTGHYVESFGAKANNLNFVAPGALTFVGKSAAGDLLQLHLVSHVSFSASGQSTIFVDTVC